MIRKTILLVTGTVAGVVGVVGYNPPQLDAAIAPTGGTSSPSPTQLQPTSSPTQTQSKVSASKPNSTKSTANKSTANKSTAAKSGTGQKSVSTPTTGETTAPVATKPAGTSGVFQGNTSQTRWGPVQVEITVTDGQITNVSTLQYPSGDRRSLNISSQVLPWLQQEVLKAQSANITGISGATYTSTGFRTSLASALQKAGL